MTIEAAITEINEADLSPTTRAYALALVELAHPENGHTCLEWSELASALQVSTGTARRQLGYMQAANIIHYSTNGAVYITFMAWLPADSVARGRANFARGRAIWCLHLTRAIGWID